MLLGVLQRRDKHACIVYRYYCYYDYHPHQYCLLFRVDHAPGTPTDEQNVLPPLVIPCDHYASLLLVSPLSNPTIFPQRPARLSFC